MKIGDGVISDTGYFCGECDMCKRGQYQSCRNGRSLGTINGRRGRADLPNTS